MRACPQLIEPLEQRLFLDANDPVLVLLEPIQELGDIHGIDDVAPYLWHSPVETLWDLHAWDQNPPPWNNRDQDSNGYPDDAYGWNFESVSPNFITTDWGHGLNGMRSAVKSIKDAETPNWPSRVKIMFVIPGGYFDEDAEPSLDVISNVPTPPLQYILNQKAAGANIVAIGGEPGNATRAGAEALEAAGIMLIGGATNSNVNLDPELGSETSAFYCATPRSGVQLAPLDNIIPVTTDPRVLDQNGNPILTGYGINSYVGGAAGYNQQSFSGPAAAAMAAVAVQAYQDAHGGANPTVQQIKRAMMSGVDYITNLNNRTITHDYANGVRQDGGLFNQSKIIAAINQTTPEVTAVAMNQTPLGTFGTKVQFDFQRVGAPTNWTTSWGDNSEADGSGVRVYPGAQLSAEHTFPFENVPHHYFPTIYAMSSTNQVYLQASQAEVVNTKWAPTGDQDNYTLSVSGSNLTLTLVNANGTTTETFAPSEMIKPIFTLGQDADTLTLDFTNGNPLQSIALTVKGTAGAGNIVRVIGSAGNDTMSVGPMSVTVNGSSSVIDSNIRVYVNARAGDDALTVTGTRVYLDESETFGELNLHPTGGVELAAGGGLVLRAPLLNMTNPTAFIDLNDNDLIVDYSGTSPATVIQGRINTARHGGLWDRPGITSTMAKNNPSHATTLGLLESAEFWSVYGNDTPFAGQTIDSTCVLVKHTWYGDSDFNGVVDFDDYANTDYGYNNSLAGWLNGDFDANARVDFDDYVLIDFGYNQQSGQLRGFGGGETAWQRIAQMEHFSTEYMYYLIAELERYDIWLTEADFLV